MQYTFEHSPGIVTTASLPLQTVSHRLCRLPTVAVCIQHVLQAVALAQRRYRVSDSFEIVHQPNRVGREFLAEVAEYSPNGRIAEPGEIASLVVFLASDAGRHITGTMIPIDGGLTA